MTPKEAYVIRFSNDNGAAICFSPANEWHKIVLRDRALAERVLETLGFTYTRDTKWVRP